MVKYTVQEIFSQHQEQLLSQLSLPYHQYKALTRLSQCRTAALGGHAQYCEQGHLNGVWYNSCKHRACPQCRGMATEEWLVNTQSLLLDCPHHHVIFTMPSELNTVWRFNREVMADILFKAVQETLHTFAKDKKHLGATVGMLSVLHTWGRNLSLHPHLHVLITHGGLNQEGEWVSPKRQCLFPQKPVMQVYRGKLRAKLKQHLNAGQLTLPTNLSPQTFENLLNKLGRQDWTVHFCERYDHGEGVAKYLSRYVKSGPLKSSQLVKVTDNDVTFRYHSHQTKRTETLTTTIPEFARRLLEHVPAPRKSSVRYSGLYHVGGRAKLNQARRHHRQAAVSERQVLRWQAYLTQLGYLPTCHVCGGPLIRTENSPPNHRH